MRRIIRGICKSLLNEQNPCIRLLGIPFSGGHWDLLRIEPSGLISLEGWCAAAELGGPALPKAILDSRELPLLHIHRTYRPDAAKAAGLSDQFPGLVVSWLDTSFAPGKSAQHSLKIAQAGNLLFKHDFSMAFSEPHYSHLLHTDKILARNQIYGVGPPAAENPESVVALARKLRGKVLDFGCGSGFLVKTLRAQGIEAYGLEINRETIRRHLHPEARDYVTLYDGSLPAPFEENAFDGIISSEVLEHVPDPEAALREIARLCKSLCILTVPDASAIPICYYSHVTPWHLLEATHQSFFTQAGLEKALRSMFQRMTFLRLHPERTNNSTWYGSLAVIAEKKL